MPLIDEAQQGQMQPPQGSQPPPGQPPQPQPDDAQPQGMDGQDQGQPADPQQQNQYDLMVSNAMEFINGEKTRDRVLRMLSQGPPAQAIANVVAAIGAMLKKTADAAGKTISQDAMLAAATEVISQLIELGQAAGIFKFSSQQEVDDTAKKALMMATQQFGEGILNTQEGQQMRPEAQAAVQQKLQQEQAGPVRKPIEGMLNQARQSQ